MKETIQKVDFFSPPFVVEIAYCVQDTKAVVASSNVFLQCSTSVKSLFICAIHVWCQAYSMLHLKIQNEHRQLVRPHNQINNLNNLFT